MTTNYHYDGDSIDVLYETNGDGKVVRQYVYSDDNVRLAMKMNGKTLYYHYNAHGDVIALTDEAGKIVAEYAYDAWGNVLKNTASTEEAKANPYAYAGYTYDKEIEQYYLMARYYEPEQGVFTAYDPDPGDEDDPQTMNGYNYANNNPVMMVDPDGNLAWWIGAAGGGAALELGRYLVNNRKKGYSWKGAGKAVLWGAAKGVLSTGGFRYLLSVRKPLTYVIKGVRKGKIRRELRIGIKSIKRTYRKYTKVNKKKSKQVKKFDYNKKKVYKGKIVKKRKRK